LLGLLLEPAHQGVDGNASEVAPNKELEKSGNIRENYLKIREI
jgi:hypothetical protein